MIEQLLKEIRQASEALLTDGTLQSERGNKAALSIVVQSSFLKF